MKSCTSEQRSHYVQLSTPGYQLTTQSIPSLPYLKTFQKFQIQTSPLSILSPLLRLAPPTVLAPHSVLPDFEFPILLYLIPILRNCLAVELFFPELGCLERHEDLCLCIRNGKQVSRLYFTIRPNMP